MSSRIERAADAAIDLALSLIGTGETGERIYKTDRDFATSVDLAIEDAVRELLEHETPDIGFLGEERGRTGKSGYYWSLDPIDGTTNFSRGLPNYGVSLALIENDQPVFGTIALPAHGERYLSRGASATLNGHTISVAPTSLLKDAIVSVGDFATGVDSESKNERRLGALAALAASVGRIRMLGSAATDLAWLAAGRLDAVLIDANRTWDVAAGIALARAAGAAVSHVDGTPYGLHGPDVLAAVPSLHRALVSALA
ncbi:inositol monophosphatase [Cellulomonas algicola]|uniref:inositol-phosphate phosphatase n=1 Tax=Cellulomonas algicola TaxID=2071633 RepID=A0A401V0Z4_9CELL|nr:inositol monophosphatase family protein [Cellulomonas algicola]GCD20564.1 inositol monophosphatase [Cellulomonas algicola]